MDSGLIRTVPSALAGAATGLGYAHDVMVLLSVSQYLLRAIMIATCPHSS